MLPSTCISSYRRCFTALAVILFNANFVTHFNCIQLLSIILFFFFLDLLCQGWIWSRGTTTPEQRCTWQLQKVRSPLAYTCFLTPRVNTSTRKPMHTHTHSCFSYRARGCCEVPAGSMQSEPFPQRQVSGFTARANLGALWLHNCMLI